jgi:hypothetical protein
MTSAAAGDIVLFRGGTYATGTKTTPDDYAAFNPSNSGTADRFITFMAYPGETPVISSPVNCATDSLCTAFGSGHRNYIIWDGMTGTAVHPNGDTVSQFALAGYSSTGNIVRNCNLTGFVMDSHANTSLIRAEKCSGCEITNNNLHDMTGSTAAVNTTAIWIFASDNIKVHHNTIYNGKYGIMQKTGPNINNSYYNNFFLNLTSDAVYLNEQYSGGSGGKVYNNVLVNAGSIYLVGVSDTATVNSYQVYNNTLYGSYASINTTKYVKDLQVWNNIIYRTSTGFYLRYYSGTALPSFSNFNAFYPKSGLVWNLDYTTDYSSLTNWNTATGLDANSVTTDPQFVRPGGTTPVDYKRSSYPTNGRSGTVMGAYTTGQERIGYLPPPRSLRY